MAWTVQISGTGVDVLAEPALSMDDAIEARSTLGFTVREDTGAVHYQKGQPVELWDDANNLVFAGVIDSVSESKPSPVNPMLWHAVKCADFTYLSDKRIARETYQNMLAGDIIADLVNKYLMAEGVVGQNAVRRTSNTTDWGLGSYTGLIVTADGDGAIKFAKSGTDYTRTDSVAADWNAGTRSGIGLKGLSSDFDTATNGDLQIASFPAIKFTGTSDGTSGNAYQPIGPAVSQAIASGDYLYYEVYCANCPTPQAAVDAVTTGSTNGHNDIRDSAIFDQAGLSAHPATDLTGYADGQWYARAFPLTNLVGFSVTQWQLAFEGDIAGNYTAYFRKIIVYNSSNAVKYTVWDGGAAPSVGTLASAHYTNVNVDTATTYTTGGTFVSRAAALASVGLAGTSAFSWTADVPSGTSLSLYTSIDGGNTWQAASTSGASIAGLIAGGALAGATLVYRAVFSGVANNPEAAGPVVHDASVSVHAGYSATKSDFFKLATTQADWQAWSRSFVTAYTGDGDGYMAPTGAYRNWDNLDVSAQTLFGTNNPAQNANKRRLNLSADNGHDARVRFDWAGTFADFTAEFDWYCPPAGCDSGIVYRTTGWQNNDATAAYYLGLSATQGHFARGTNSASGTGAWTQLVTPTVSLTPGTLYRVRVVVQGSSHKLYVNGALVVNGADSTYTAAGSLGPRMFNGSGTNGDVALFDSFGIVSQVNSANPTGPLVHTASGGYNLNGGASLTVAGSFAAWDVDANPTNPVLVQAAVDSGSGYGADTSGVNGGTIPNIGAGGSYKAVRHTFTWTLNDLRAGLPHVRALLINVPQAYSMSGVWTSASFDISDVDRAGNTSLSFTDSVPAGTTVAAQASTDGGATWATMASGDKLPGINVESPPTVDTFDADTSANWTIGVGTAEWDWDVNNSRLVGSIAAGASSSDYLTVNGLSMQNGSVEADVDEASAFNLMIRRVGISCYRLQVFDSTDEGGGSMTLYRRVAGLNDAVIGSASNIGFVTGSVHRVKLTASGNTLQAFFDGTAVITFNDTDANAILDAGTAGIFLPPPVNGTNGFSAYTFAARPQGDSLAGKTVQTRYTLTSTDATQTPIVYDETVSVRSADIQDGNLIVEATFNYVSVTDCIAALAEQADYWWEIDQNKRLKFKAREVEAAPFPITSGPQGIILDGNVTVTNGNPLYRNTEYITDFTDISDEQTEKFKGDGATQTFTVGMPIALVPTVKVNGVVQTVGIKNVDSGKQWYWNKGDNTITQDTAGTPLAAVDTLEVDYQGQFPSMTVSQDLDKVFDRQAVEGGGSGIVEDVTSAPQLTSASSALDLANAKLQRYGVIGRTLAFDTYTPGLVPGLLASVYVPEHGLWGDQLLIDKVTVTAQDGGRLLYSVSCVEGPVTSSWEKLFADLAGSQRMPVEKLNLGQNSTVPVQAPVTNEQWSWTENTPSVTAYACPVPSATLYPSTTLYPC